MKLLKSQGDGKAGVGAYRISEGASNLIGNAYGAVKKVDPNLKQGLENLENAVSLTLNTSLQGYDIATSNILNTDSQTPATDTLNSVGRLVDGWSEETKGNLILASGPLSLLTKQAGKSLITNALDVFDGGLGGRYGDKIPFGGGYSSTIVNYRNADDLNQLGIKRVGDSYQNEWQPGSTTIEFTPTTDVDYLARVYTASEYGPKTLKSGNWLLRQSDINGLTGPQIKDKFGLPQTPTHVSNVNIPQFEAPPIRVGSTAQGAFGATGTGTQYNLLIHQNKINDEWFKNSQPLPSIPTR